MLNRIWNKLIRFWFVWLMLIKENDCKLIIKSLLVLVFFMIGWGNLSMSLVKKGSFIIIVDDKLGVFELVWNSFIVY